MNYYILPKKNNKILIDIKTTPDTPENKLNPCVSISVDHYLQVINKQIEEQKKQNENINYETIYKIANPYDLIFSNVPGLKFAVSKLKYHNNIFYLFMEVIINFNILENFTNNNITTIHYGENIKSTIDCINILREDYSDTHLFFEDVNNTHNDINDEYKHSVEILFFELNTVQNNGSINKYIVSLINCLQKILNYQKYNGISIIKVNALFYKPIVEILYILTNIYEKIYIVKANTANIINGERIIICKNYMTKNTFNQNNYLELSYKLHLQSQNIDDSTIIQSIISNNIPCYFLNKIEDSNINFGHSQIEQLDLILYIIKNKNRDEKIDTIKKNNIIKCIQWCEKYKIPYNKFVDKINIFLPCSYINYNTNSLQDIIVNDMNDINDIDNDIQIEQDNNIIQNVMNEIIDEISLHYCIQL